MSLSVCVHMHMHILYILFETLGKMIMRHYNSLNCFITEHALFNKISRTYYISDNVTCLVLLFVYVCLMHIGEFVFAWL